MVVDWHNTIEEHDRVSFQNEKALNKLMDYADVHILSYVETQWRENEVHKQVKQLLSPSTRSKLKGVHCCYERVGLHGKLGWCRKLNASGIIDDNNDIINECRAEGLLCFAVVTRHCQHGNLPTIRLCSPLAATHFCWHNHAKSWFCAGELPIFAGDITPQATGALRARHWRGVWRPAVALKRTWWRRDVRWIQEGATRWVPPSYVLSWFRTVCKPYSN